MHQKLFTSLMQTDNHEPESESEAPPQLVLLLCFFFLPLWGCSAGVGFRYFLLLRGFDFAWFLFVCFDSGFRVQLQHAPRGTSPFATMTPVAFPQMTPGVFMSGNLKPHTHSAHGDVRLLAPQLCAESEYCAPTAYSEGFWATSLCYLSAW